MDYEIWNLKYEMMKYAEISCGAILNVFFLWNLEFCIEGILVIVYIIINISSSKGKKKDGKNTTL